MEDTVNIEPQSTPVTDLSGLRRGEDIEARRGTASYRGRVKETAPGLGMVWIREHSGALRALSVDDCSIHRVARPADSVSRVGPPHIWVGMPRPARADPADLHHNSGQSG
jgi:hypothetical protein